jgi:hypothetical protein
VITVAGRPGIRADVEAHRVAELQAKLLRQAVFDAGSTGLVFFPLARRHRVVPRQLRAVAQIELAFDQTLRTLGAERFRRHRLAVHRDKTAADHRVPVVAFNACAIEHFAKRLLLLGLDVDDEAVRRVRRRGLAPARYEIGAQQHQQHEGQQPDGQR